MACSHSCLVIILLGLNNITIHNPSNGVLVDCPLGSDGHILCRHHSNGPIPALEGITFSVRIHRICNLGVIILGYFMQFIANTIYPSNSILINSPLGSDGHVLSRHVCRNLYIPASEGVTSLTGSSRMACIHSCLVIILLGLNSYAIHNPSNGVLVDAPLSSDGHILSRHVCGNLYIPASEGVTSLTGSSRMACIHSCLVIILLGLNNLTIHNPSNGVLVDCPLGVVGSFRCILVNRIRIYLFTAILRSEPALKGIPHLTGSSG